MRCRTFIATVCVGPLLACQTATASAHAIPAYATSNAIVELAATQGRMAWIEKHADGCVQVLRRPVLRMRVPTLLTRCHQPLFGAAEGRVGELALDGVRAYWSETGFHQRDDVTDLYEIASVHHHVTIASFVDPCGLALCVPHRTGRRLGVFAAADGAVYYSSFDVATDAVGAETITSATLHRAVIGSGGVEKGPVVGAPAAALLDVSAGLLVESPADLTTGVPPAPTSTIQVRNDRTGHLRWSATLPSTVRSVSITGSYTVALVRTSVSRSALHIFRTDTGAPVATLSFAHRVHAEQSANARIVIAQSGSILVYDVDRRILRVIAAPRRPLGDLDIHRKLVTWRTLRVIHAAQDVP